LCFYVHVEYKIKGVRARVNLSKNLFLCIFAAYITSSTSRFSSHKREWNIKNKLSYYKPIDSGIKAHKPIPRENIILHTWAEPPFYM